MSATRNAVRALVLAPLAVVGAAAAGVVAVRHATRGTDGVTLFGTMLERHTEKLDLRDWAAEDADEYGSDYAN